jgi:hypothetical protein
MWTLVTAGTDNCRSERKRRKVSSPRELEAAPTIHDRQNSLNVEQVRSELENNLRSGQSENKDLNRKVEDYLREVSQLRERNQDLEAEMSKVARVGRREELNFAEEARTWPGIYVSDKLPKNGDFLLAFRDPSGNPLEPRMLIDNKDKATVAESDLDKLVRDATERSTPVAILVARDEEQLRQVDRETRWSRKDGIWILRTTRQWLPRDLDVLKPLFERMRLQGSDFLGENAALAEEVRCTFADLDRVESELKKAAKAIGSASGLVAKYRNRMQELCDNTGGGAETAKCQDDSSDIP